MKPRTILAVTPGDPEGIGPEIVWKTLRSGRFAKKGVALLCVGAREPFDELGARVIEANPEELQYPKGREAKRPFVWLVPAPLAAPGGNHLPGFQSGWSIERAVQLVQEGEARALVTGPISKERLQSGGFPYPGHTEFLASLCGSGPVTMMLANAELRVTLVTTHLALKEVPKALTAQKIERCVLQTAQCLREWWGIRKPKVAVLALNPHAGEAGIFGREEITVIAPELNRLGAKYSREMRLTGPHPADTFFAKEQLLKRQERHDAVVCMYHDQGLIPVKLLDFKRTVNVTLGLPLVRTSVDHGVAFDIAGTGKADPASFQAAVELALQIVRIRRGK
ncbi:MAG: 4-hydroxythreonine-4-phosphate dehydrogenase PdxA [Bdellovibrionota bacterium]